MGNLLEDLIEAGDRLADRAWECNETGHMDSVLSGWKEAVEDARNSIAWAIQNQHSTNTDVLRGLRRGCVQEVFRGGQMTETQEALAWAETGHGKPCYSSGTPCHYPSVLALSLRSLMAERDTLSAKLKIAEKALLVSLRTHGKWASSFPAVSDALSKIQKENTNV